MLRGDAPHPACRGCGIATDRLWVDPSFALASAPDASYTYDGYLIVSQRFREVLGEADVRYVELPCSAGFYSLTVARQVRFDAQRRGTSFNNPCPECGRYYDVAGAIPVFLLDEVGPEDIARTDVEFGSADEQHPLILLGVAVGLRLTAAGLTGVDLLTIGHVER